METPSENFYRKVEELKFSMNWLSSMLNDYKHLFSPDILSGIEKLITNTQHKLLEYIPEYDKASDEKKEDVESQVDIIINNLKRFKEGFTGVNNYYDELNKLSNMAETRYLDDVYADDDEENSLPPLPLTSEELYYAFTFLTKEQIKIVLSKQSPVIFNRLFTAFENGKEDFIQTLDEVDYCQFFRLREFLSHEIEKVYPFNDFIIKGEEGNNLAQLLIDEAIKNNGEEAENVINIISSGNLDSITPIESIPSPNLFLNRDLYRNVSKKINSEYLTLSEKNRAERVYEECRAINPDVPELGSQEIKDYSDRQYSLTFRIEEKWIMKAISDRMAQDVSMATEDIDNNNEESEGIHLGNENSSFPQGKFKRLEFPTRISNNKSMDPTVKVKILVGLYGEYGRYLETLSGDKISENEFIYLFSGDTKERRPDNYHTPYYWNGDENVFPGLLRLLYNGQKPGIDSIILPITDKGKTESSIKWSVKKVGLGEGTLKPIEDKIQEIVKNVGLEPLKDVDLSSKTNRQKRKINN